MATLQSDVSLYSQGWQRPFHSYGGQACNPLMADDCADRTPLHEAAAHGRLLQLRTLVAQGFHVDTLTLGRVSPLHEACLGGHYACAKFLLENGAKADAASIDGATPLFNSCSSGSAACVTLVLLHSPSSCTTSRLASPVHEAAKKNHRACLELLLLSSGAHINTELPELGTPLYSACLAQAVPCVELLLRSGADVRLGCGQDSPLHAAARGGQAATVELLLDFGADMSRRNADGKSPLDVSTLHSAVRTALQKRGPSSLTQLCRISVRQSLGSGRLHRTSSLCLPHAVSCFLLYK